MSITTSPASASSGAEYLRSSAEIADSSSPNTPAPSRSLASSMSVLMVCGLALHGRVFKDEIDLGLHARQIAVDFFQASAPAGGCWPDASSGSIWVAAFD